MAEYDRGVALMLDGYKEMIRRFVLGEATADEFETAYLRKFKHDSSQVPGPEFEILDGLFADVDDYVADPELLDRAGGLSGDELRTRARSAYVRLFGSPEAT